MLLSQTRKRVRTVRPTNILPSHVTNGIVPGAIAESFDFWELKRTGNWKGHRRVQRIDNERGEKIDFVDPYYNYNLEVRQMGTSAAVVRQDMDQVTLEISGRRLINLTNSCIKASTEIVRLLTRIESLSHILAWSSSSEYESAFHNGNVVPELVELPCLRVSFHVVHLDDGEVRLYVIDSGGKYVLSNQNKKVNPKILKGCPDIFYYHMHLALLM